MSFPRLLIHPRYAEQLQGLGLTRFEDFLRLHGTIVSGHPNRQVERIELDDELTVYLKREHHVPLKERVESWWSGFGLVSKSSREGHVLRALERTVSVGPQWLAFGEDDQGRAFLLLREIPEALDLPCYLHQFVDDESHQSNAQSRDCSTNSCPASVGQDCILSPRDDVVAEMRGDKRRAPSLLDIPLTLDGRVENLSYGRKRSPSLARRVGVASFADRSLLAEQLGIALGRLHDHGFHHGDLYASHVLIQPTTEQIFFLDWQRAQRRRTLRWSHRAHDLAALLVTLPDHLFGESEKQTCLEAYWHTLSAFDRLSFPQFSRRVQSRQTELNNRKHVRSKRQRTAWIESQSLIPVQGDSLQITHDLLDLWPAGVPDWLTDQMREPCREWIPLPDGGEAFLNAQRCRIPWMHRWHLTKRPWISPPRRQMSLLHRLQRVGVIAPRILAVGDNPLSSSENCSFLLIRPPAQDGVFCEVFPELQAEHRKSMLRETGHLLARLHSTGCQFSGDVRSLAYRHRDAQLEVVLKDVEGLKLQRRRSGRDQQRDLEKLIHGLSLTRKADLESLLEGHSLGMQGLPQRAMEASI